MSLRSFSSRSTPNPKPEIRNPKLETQIQNEDPNAKPIDTETFAQPHSYPAPHTPPPTPNPHTPHPVPQTANRQPPNVRQLTSLNRKFTGDLSGLGEGGGALCFVGGILPDLLFRCPKRCLACGHQVGERGLEGEGVGIGRGLMSLGERKGQGMTRDEGCGRPLSLSLSAVCARLL